MGATAQVKVELTSQAKLAALVDYNKRTAEATERTAHLRSSMQQLTQMGKLGAVFAGANLSMSALTAQMTAMTNGADAIAGEIERASSQASMAAEPYQVLSRILKGAGGEAESLTAAVKILRNALGEAQRDPDGGPAKTLKEIGESASALSRLRPEQSLERVARALSRVADPARRAAIAQDLLGRGASELTPLLERLASDGYEALRTEIERTAGIMSGDLARALDDAADRTEAASNRMSVALAPFQVKVAETKASLAELFADIATAPKDAGWGVGIGAAAGTAVVAGSAFAAGGLGSPAAWGVLAAASWAKASATLVPAWMGIGAIIAAGFAGAAAIKGLQDSKIAQNELEEIHQAAPLDQAKALRKQLMEARSIEMRNRIQMEAARRSLATEKRAKETDDPVLRSNLELAVRIYDGLIAHSREHGESIVAANKTLDEANAKRAEAEKLTAKEVEREKEAVEWLKKNAAALEEKNAELARSIALDHLTPAQRIAHLEQERTAVLQANERFTGTAAEIRRNDLETTARVLELDKAIAVERKTLASETERAFEAQLKLAQATGPDFARRKEVSPEDLARGVDVASSMRLAELQAQAGKDQGSFRLTEEEKRALRRKNLEEQRAVLDESAGMLRAGGDAQRAQQFEDRSASIGAQLGADEAGTPESTLDGVGAGLTQIEDRWGSLAQQMRTSVSDIGDTITDSIGGGLQQVLGTTEFWSQRLGNIGGPIMGGITQSISRMFSEWIVARGAAAAKNILFATKEGAAETAAKAPGALFSSISSFGTAALVGVAAFLAAKAVATGFKTGGYTGGSDPSAPAGVVHEDEWVAPAWMVNHPRYSEMIATLEAARVGKAEFGIGGFVGDALRYGGIPKFMLPSSTRRFMDSYNFIDGTKFYGGDAEEFSATYDYGSQQWIRNPDQSVEVPEALRPQAMRFAAEDASATGGTEEAAPLPQVVLIDHRDQDLIDRVLSDPRFESKVRRIGRRNTGDFGSPS